MKIGCVFLASGSAERFGSNKLLTTFFGRTLVENTLAAVPAEWFARAVVVSAYDRVEEIARALGFEVKRNAHPEYGVSHTIGLGLREMEDMDACMFCVCDQPYLAGQSVRELLASYAGGIFALSCGGQRGNPVIFPKELFGELLALKAGESGGAVIARHADMLSLLPVQSPLELADVDTREDLSRLLNVKNLFVTGAREAGKSTLLSYAVSFAGVQATGFVTRPYEVNGHIAGHAMHALSPLIALEDNDKPISVREGAQSCIPVARVFDEFGARYLRAARQDDRSLILMDELGLLERDAESFQEEAALCLDGKKPVLGSLKRCGESWLKHIAERDDTLVLELTEDARDAVLQRVLQFLYLRGGNHE